MTESGRLRDYSPGDYEGLFLPSIVIGCVIVPVVSVLLVYFLDGPERAEVVGGMVLALTAPVLVMVGVVFLLGRVLEE